MAKFGQSPVAGAGGFRLWPVISVAALRRKLLEALMCGGVASSPPRRGGPGGACPPERRPTSGSGGSERLAELLRAEASESEEAEASETRRKVEAFEALQKVVRSLQSGDNGDVGERKEAALEVRRLAKDDVEARETLAMLGAIPPLVGALDPGDPELHVAALYALLNLGIGNDVNKAAIVKAGAVHKMLTLIESGSDPSVSEAIVANFLGLSALDSNKPLIGSSGALPFLVDAFKNPSPRSAQVKQDALRALFNLSIAAGNVPLLVDAGLVPCLVAAIGDMEISERALAVLSNAVATAEGRRAVARSPDAFLALVDVLGWADAPGCQEKAAYILMVMAHKAAAGDRAAMAEAGIVSALLELTLIGSPLAQKRSSRLLEILRVDKGKQVSEGFGDGCSGIPGVSAPLCSLGPAVAGAGAAAEAEMSEERLAVRQLVQQSLQSNMRRIVRRANLPPDFAPSEHFRTLTATATSKSLPF